MPYSHRIPYRFLGYSVARPGVSLTEARGLRADLGGARLPKPPKHSIPCKRMLGDGLNPARACCRFGASLICRLPGPIFAVHPQRSEG